ncbi:hypothetical protein CEXT_173471 [Caerostris extrusa]|uniref:Uncharacterized protein n=1 Tax=Caerostris extrusa TaxID=172846 RepID=A0AAV4MWH3_CAEEX|nr:hypothetical protein CEXT_173471 [Caerostris extrusa]
MEDDIPFIVDRTYKRSTVQNDSKSALSGIHSQIRRNPLYMDRSLLSLFLLQLRRSWSNKGTPTATDLDDRKKKRYHFLKKNDQILNNGKTDMALADGHVQNTEILTTTVDIGAEGKIIPTKLIVLKTAKGNRSLLEADFLSAQQESFWIFR